VIKNEFEEPITDFRYIKIGGHWRLVVAMTNGFKIFDEGKIF